MFSVHDRHAGRHAALVLGHPGHELRLSGWIEKAKPVVHVLTCGSRHGASCARTQATKRIVEDLGGTVGQLFGEILDRDFYQLVIDGKVGPFHTWADALRDAWLAAPPAFVVTDAWQFYSVTHDLVHLMTRVAAAEAGMRLGQKLPCLDFAVVPPAIARQVRLGRVELQIRLSQADLERKIALAHAYPEITGELAEFAKAAGSEALATETLHDPPPPGRLAPAPGTIPDYERHGASRVAAGIYSIVLRWAHVQPIYASLLKRFNAASRLAA